MKCLYNMNYTNKEPLCFTTNLYTLRSMIYFPSFLSFSLDIKHCRASVKISNIYKASQLELHKHSVFDRSCRAGLELQRTDTVGSVGIQTTDQYPALS